MATMTARYDGRCAGCGGAIRRGDRIEYDGAARHVGCGADKRSTPRRAQSPAGVRAPRSSYPTSALEPGAHEISGRAERGDRYTVGQVVHAPKVAVPGGGPDGHYYTVLAETWVPADEDQDHFDARRYAWVRAATDAEAAPVVPQVTAALGRKADDARLREIAALCMAGEHRDDLPQVSGCPIIDYQPPTPMGPAATLAVHGDDVHAWHPGHYDDWRATHGAVADPALAVEVLAIIARRAS